MSNNTNYLFYSQNYCEHSKRIIAFITKLDALHPFILCNVANQDLMIPPFITTVPTLYLSNERQILKDNELFQWIDNQFSKSSNNTKELSMQDVTGSSDIFAYTESELGCANGPAYSFIDDNANDMIASSFEMLDGSNKDKLTVPTFTRIDSIPQDGNSVPNNTERDQRKSELDKAYDDLMKSRSMEQMSNPMNQRL